MLGDFQSEDEPRPFCQRHSSPAIEGVSHKPGQNRSPNPCPLGASGGISPAVNSRRSHAEEIELRQPCHSVETSQRPHISFRVYRTCPQMAQSHQWTDGKDPWGLPRDTRRNQSCEGVPASPFGWQRGGWSGLAWSGGGQVGRRVRRGAEEGRNMMSHDGTLMTRKCHAFFITLTEMVRREETSDDRPE